MECPSCTFQNSPGTRTCVRCRSLLDLSLVDFIPPRAARGGTRRRLRGSVDAGRGRVIAVMSDIGRFVQMPDPAVMRWAEIPWLLVPGGAQLRSPVRGLRVLGWAVLLVWCLLLLASLAILGADASRILAMASISVHGFGIALAFTPMLQARPLLHRLAFGLALFVVLLFGVYRPASLLLARCIGVLPIAGVRPQQVIANGDVLLYTGAWMRPDSAEWRRGDLVVTTVDPLRGHGVVIVGGYNVDRIVAVPGDVVRARAGELTINGRTPPRAEQPLCGLSDLPSIDTTLDEGTYLVFTSALNWQGQGQWRPLVMQAAPGMSFVTSDNLLGRVWFRLRPWRRAGFIGRNAE